MTLTPLTELQCGHDPKAVENLESQFEKCLLTELQCGHDPKAVENNSLATNYVLTQLASMRPRPEGRGELRLCR